MAKFRLELDPVPLKKGADVAGKALDNLGNKAKKTETKVVASATKSGNAFVRMGQKMDGRTRFIFNNTANQLGDMAVQGSMGTDMFRVMGMQLPQLAGGFALLGGSLGIVMPILGVLAAIGFPIIAAFRAMSGATGTLAEELEDLEGTLSVVTRLTKQSIQPIDNQAGGFDRVALAVNRARNSILEFNMIALDRNLDSNMDLFANMFGNIETFADIETQRVQKFQQLTAKFGIVEGFNPRALANNEKALADVQKQFGLTEDQAISYLSVLAKIGNTADDDKERLIVMEEMLTVTKDIFKNYEGQDNQKLAFEERNASATKLYNTLEKIRDNEDLIRKNALKIEIARKRASTFNILETGEDTAGTRIKKKKRTAKTPLDKELQELEAYVKRIKPVITLTQDYEFAVSMLDIALEREVLTQQ